MTLNIEDIAWVANRFGEACRPYSDPLSDEVQELIERAYGAGEFTYVVIYEGRMGTLSEIEFTDPIDPLLQSLWMQAPDGLERGVYFVEDLGCWCAAVFVPADVATRTLVMALEQEMVDVFWGT